MRDENLVQARRRRAAQRAVSVMRTMLSTGACQLAPLRTYVAHVYGEPGGGDCACRRGCCARGHDSGPVIEVGSAALVALRALGDQGMLLPSLQKVLCATSSPLPAHLADRVARCPSLKSGKGALASAVSVRFGTPDSLGPAVRRVLNQGEVLRLLYAMAAAGWLLGPIFTGSKSFDQLDGRCHELSCGTMRPLHHDLNVLLQHAQI